MEEIKFQSKWFEKCIRDFLEIGDAPITKEMLSSIKYLYVATSHYYGLEFSKEELPDPFCFRNAGDEWDLCTLSNTNQYEKIEDFIEIEHYFEDSWTLALEKEEELNKKLPKADKELMKKFEESVKAYAADTCDFEGLEEDECSEWGILIPEDFSYLTGLQVVRLMSCCVEIHTLKFLNSLPNLKILEIGEVDLHDLEGLENLKNLDKLCIWSN